VQGTLEQFSWKLGGGGNHGRKKKSRTLVLLNRGTERGSGKRGVNWGKVPLIQMLKSGQKGGVAHRVTRRDISTLGGENRGRQEHSGSKDWAISDC